MNKRAGNQDKSLGLSPTTLVSSSPARPLEHRPNLSMSSTTSSLAATATACANLYDTPVQDAACAMPYSRDHVDQMQSCCKNADVVSYYNNCGLYCLAQGQSVADLTDCLFKKGAAYQDVFCRGNTTATATETGSVKPPATASASVVSNRDASKTSKGGNGRDASATSSGSAASGTKLQAQFTLWGLSVGSLLVSAFVVGALRV